MSTTQDTEIARRIALAQQIAAALVTKGHAVTLDGGRIKIGSEQVAMVHAETSGYGHRPTGCDAIAIEGVRSEGDFRSLATRRSVVAKDAASVEKAIGIIAERCAMRAEQRDIARAKTVEARRDRTIRDELEELAPVGVAVEVRGGVVRLTVSPLTPQRARAMLAALAIVAS